MTPNDLTITAGTVETPAAVWDAALALDTGEGIELVFSSDRATHSFRARLYAKRLNVRHQSRKYPESKMIVDPGYDTSPWDDIQIISKAPRTLWVGVPDAKAFGIVRTRVTKLSKSKRIKQCT